MSKESMVAQFIKDVIAEPTNEEMHEISTLAQQQLELEKEVKEYERILEEAKESLRHIQEVLLPEAMATVGMSEFKLANGAKITIKDDVYASLRADYILDAVKWLDGMGLGDIVKDDVTVKFGRGDSDKAKDIVSYAQAQGYNVSEKMSVHPQTLKATVKEQLARGVQFPEEFFSINPVKKSVIKTK